jgi:hypothetical protein
MPTLSSSISSFPQSRSVRQARHFGDGPSLHATIEEFAAQGFTHVECYCPRCRMIRLRPISWLPRISIVGTDRDRKTGALRALLAHPNSEGLNYAGAAFIALPANERIDFLAEVERLTCV